MEFNLRLYLVFKLPLKWMHFPARNYISEHEHSQKQMNDSQNFPKHNIISSLLKFPKLSNNMF